MGSKGVPLHRRLHQLQRNLSSGLTAVRESVHTRPTPRQFQCRQERPRTTTFTRCIFNRAAAQVLDNAKISRSGSRPLLRATSLKSDDLRKIKTLQDAILNHPRVPSEKETLGALKAVEAAAQMLFGILDGQLSRATDDATPASALLSLGSRPGVTNENIDFLSSVAYRIVTHHPVFITPSILYTYVNIQSLLLKPESFPEIFALYANKPVPSKVSSPSGIMYASQNPRAIAAAIPTSLANAAVNTAIHVRDLHTALDIISTTFRAPAFQRAKLFRRALPPAACASLAPVAAYMLASQLSGLQTALPPEDFTAFAFAGMLTYSVAVGAIGYIALTTANDQMQRVTWVPGTPLWERWVREEERSACDRVAVAWGFKEKWRWGEEEGQEWEELKEYVSIKGMFLDKLSLMEDWG